MVVYASLSQGEDLGPLELKIDALQKQISDSVEKCVEMQSFWLRQQNDLVRTTKEAEEEARAVDSMRKQQLILQQKKMRIDGRSFSNMQSGVNLLCVGQLERQDKEKVSVEQGIARLQYEMRRLSTLISEKTGQHQRLQQDNLLMQNDFVHALKVRGSCDTNRSLTHLLQESELECIQVQSKVEQLREEKERLLNSLVESE